jgi:hypothetical protein
MKKPSQKKAPQPNVQRTRKRRSDRRHDPELDHGGPSEKNVRIVLRDLTTLVNTAPDMLEEIHELEILVKKTTAHVKEAKGDMKELAWIRFYLEEDFMKTLKGDQTLWDGSRIQWEQKEAERRKEACVLYCRCWVGISY